MAGARQYRRPGSLHPDQSHHPEHLARGQRVWRHLADHQQRRTWAQVDDFMANLAVTTMVMQPGTPSTIYAGTGKGFFTPQFEFTSQIQGAGIFQSTDGGVTWNQLASTNN